MPEDDKNSAKGLMRGIICIPPDSFVSDAAKLMKKSNIGSVFVGSDNKPEGIFTERDLVRRVVAEGVDPFTTKVKDVMTKRMVTVKSEVPLSKVFEALAKGHFRHLPITEEGSIVGIVSITDLFNILKEIYKDDEFLKDFSKNIAG